MDIKVTKEFIDLLEYAGEKFGLVADWSDNNLIPYLQELSNKIVAYKEGIAWLWIAVGIVTILFGIVMLILQHVYDWEILGVSVFVCCLGVGVIILIFNLYTVISCKTFPERIVIEYVKSVMDTGAW